LEDLGVEGKITLFTPVQGDSKTTPPDKTRLESKNALIQI